MEKLTRLEANCTTGEIIEHILTDEEIAEREKIALETKARIEQEEIAAKHIADLKQSAKAKLVAGEPLTEEEAAIITV
jgi:hypothetical protein